MCDFSQEITSCFFSHIVRYKGLKNRMLTWQMNWLEYFVTFL